MRYHEFRFREDGRTEEEQGSAAESSCSRTQDVREVEFFDGKEFPEKLIFGHYRCPKCHRTTYVAYIPMPPRTVRKDHCYACGQRVAYMR